MGKLNNPIYRSGFVKENSQVCDKSSLQFLSKQIIDKYTHIVKSQASWCFQWYHKEIALIDSAYKFNEVIYWGEHIFAGRYWSGGRKVRLHFSLKRLSILKILRGLERVNRSNLSHRQR